MIIGTVASSHHKTNLGTLQAPTTSVSPIIPSVDDEGKGFTFTTTTESSSVDMYEFSLDNRATWIRCNNNFQSYNYNCRMNFTTDGAWGATSWDKTITIYVDNQDLATGTVHVRARARNGYAASVTFSNDAPFTYNASFDRWKPTGMLYYTSGRHNRFVSFRPSVLGWIEHTGFEVTYDGGATTQPLDFMYHYTDNKDVAIGQFGIRCVDQVTGTPLSGWLFNTVAFTAVPVTQTTVTGLKAFDSTVTASVFANNTSITLSNDNLSLQINDQICLVGSARRGAKGIDGTWPAQSYASISTANSLVAANPNDYVANLYAWDESNGKVIRLRGDKSQWDNYSDNLPDVNLCQARPLITKVQSKTVNGDGTVTIVVDKAPKITESNVVVYFDNAYYLQAVYDALPQFAEVTHPTGTYPVCTQFYLNANQTGVHLKVRGLTLFAPPKTVSASLTTYAHGAKINDYAGSSITYIKGNYNYNDMGFRIFDGDHSQWTDLFLPDLNQPLGNEYYIYNSCFRFEGVCTKVYDIEAWDSPHAVIANASNGGLVQGFKIKRNNIIPLITSEGQPYSGSYYWAAYIDTTKGATIDGQSKYGNTPALNIDQPVWLNAWEIFKSEGCTIKNIVAKNGMGSCNGSAGATYNNIVNTIDASSKYFQNTGHSCQEMNLFMGAPDGWRATVFQDYYVTLLGSLIAGDNNWYPTGFNLTTGVAGARILNCRYTRPDLTADPTAPAIGLIMQGLSAYVDGFICSGNWTDSYLTNAFGIGGGRSIYLTENAGKASDAVVKNCTAPTFVLPSSMDSANETNNTATQRTNKYYPSIWLTSYDLTNNSVIVNIADLYNKDGTIASWYWSQVNGIGATITPTWDGYEASITGLTPGDYTFRFSCANSLLASNSADINITIPSTGSQLAAPTLSASSVSSSHIHISWNTISYALSYRLRRSLDNKSWSTLALKDVSEDTSFEDTDVLADTFYYYEIKAIGDGVNHFVSAYGTTQIFNGTNHSNQWILVETEGQSNDVGRADADPANEVNIPNGIYWYRESDNSIQPLADPVGEGQNLATVRSLHPNLGKRLKELTGYNVLIVPKGLGNTSIADWQKGLNYYGWAYTAYQSALTYCAAHSMSIAYKFVERLQGENDAGILDQDGYLCELDKLTNNIIADYSPNAVLLTRIGYDPNYANAVSSEKIMEAETAYSILKPQVILTTNQTATFTISNGKKRSDNVHYTVKGLNEVGESIAKAIAQYIKDGSKITLPSEPVVSLQGLSGNTTKLAHYQQLIDGTPIDWTFNYGAGSINESSGKISSICKTFAGSNTTADFNSDGEVFAKNKYNKIGKLFDSATATVEFLASFSHTGYSLNSITGLYDFSSGFGNKILLELDTGSSILYFPSGTSSFVYWDLTAVDVTAFHVYGFIKTNTAVSLYIDGSLVSTQSCTGNFQMQMIGAGHPTQAYSMQGVMKYFKVKA